MVTNKLQDNNVTISEVTYAVSKKFSSGLFQSCFDVKNPSSGGYALDLMCGIARDKCTVEHWFNFMGDPTLNPMSPFKITFVVSANATNATDSQGDPVTLTPMNDSTVGCNESCGCQDCQAKCAVIPAPKNRDSWKIKGYDAACVIVFGVFAVFMVIFGTSQIFIILYCPIISSNTMSHHTQLYQDEYEDDDLQPLQEVQQSTDSSPDIQLPNCYEKLQNSFDRSLSEVFFLWGKFCAYHPVLVIVASIVACVILIVGICFFQVVTDPVELWSAPDSRARLEKNYFDENFG